MKLKSLSLLTVLMLLLQAADPLPVSAAVSLPITAASVILVDNSNHKVVYSKTPNLRRQPASTTKLLTSLVVLEHMDLNDVVTIPAYVEKIPPSKIHLRKGEKYRVRELLRALLMNSANDAAEALAYAAGGGSRERFANWMTQKVKSLGGNNSNFVNPSGLPDKRQYSTAADMAKIMDAVEENTFLVQTLQTRTLIIKSFAGRKIYLRNHNRMLWRPKYPLIGKTGWTRSARHCFVGEFPYQDRRLLVAMLGSHALWRDLRVILDSKFGSHLFSRKTKAKNWARPDKKTIQAALKNAGYYKGKIDGLHGSKTRSAIKKFQKDNNIRTTGTVGPLTWSKLSSFAQSR